MEGLPHKQQVADKMIEAFDILNSLFYLLDESFEDAADGMWLSHEGKRYKFEVNRHLADAPEDETSEHIDAKYYL